MTDSNNHAIERYAHAQSRDAENYTGGGQRVPEKIFIVLIIIIGIGGLCYIPKSPFAAKRGSHYSNSFHFDEPTHTDTQAAQSASHHVQVTSQPHRQLLIKGEMVAGQLLTFSIDSYDAFASYKLDMGNGFIMDVKKKSFKYAYPKAGMYDLKLIVSYRGETAVIHQEKIYINRAHTYSFLLK